MGGLRRLKPTVIPEEERMARTCTTVGCPDPAIVIVPLNPNSAATFEESRGHPWRNDVGEQGYVGTYNRTPLEMRLCRRCVRTLATALPPGMRLEGAVLRYPEVEPDVCAPEDIPGTPEFRPRRQGDGRSSRRHSVN